MVIKPIAKINSSNISPISIKVGVFPFSLAVTALYIAVMALDVLELLTPTEN
jgi:hypothetical protein